MSVIDYSDAFPAATAAHGNQNNVLILNRLDQPFQRNDGKKATYQLEYRWLSTECAKETDEAWCCVLGNEFTFWQRKEVDIAAIEAGRKTLFDCFNLFG